MTEVDDLAEPVDGRVARRQRAARKPADRESVVSAGDLLTQLESIDFLRRHRQLSVAETRTVLTEGLRALLS